MTTTTELTEKNETTPSTNKRRLPRFLPRMDVYEADKDFELRFEMPGIRKESIYLALENGALTVTGDGTATPLEGYRLSHCEYEPGSYHRTVKLGDGIDVENIEAQFSNGILKVRLAKNQKTQARKIEVHQQ